MLNVWGWGPVGAGGTTLGGAGSGGAASMVSGKAVSAVSGNAPLAASGKVVSVVVDDVAVCCRSRLRYSALVSTVGKAGQVTQAKCRSAAPNAVVAVSRSLSDVSVCTWSFMRACQVANM